MMPLHYLIAALLLLQCSSCEPPKTAGAGNTGQRETVEPKPVGISTLLTGFNAEYMTDVCIDGELKTKLENARLHDDCRAVVEALDPQVLRWPGGITAQYYHFYGEGYGYKAAEVKGTEYDGNALLLQEYLQVNFIEIFREMAAGRKVIYVANLLNGTLEENMAAVRYLQEGGVEIIGLELGNEFYFSRMEPADYLKRCQPYIDGVKDIKLAVHMAPDFGAKNQAWNAAVAKARVDAVVIHEYNRKIKNDCKQPDAKKAFFQCGLKKVDEFTGPYIQSLLANYKRKYGMKELWWTEWNIAPRTPGGVYGTYLQAYQTFALLNRLPELPVEVALFHNLVTSGSMYPVVTRKKETLTYNPDFYVHRMMPKGRYLGKARVQQCDVWYYSDGIAVSNSTGSAVTLELKQMAALGSVVPTRYELLQSAQLWERPEYSTASAVTLKLGPYGLAVLK